VNKDGHRLFRVAWIGSLTNLFIRKGATVSTLSNTPYLPFARMRCTGQEIGENGWAVSVIARSALFADLLGVPGACGPDPFDLLVVAEHFGLSWHAAKEIDKRRCSRRSARSSLMLSQRAVELPA
jgi:hypothetical protein